MAGQVAHFAQQAVQRGLVGHRAMHDGGAGALVGEAQPVEPGGPAGIEAPFEADLVVFSNSNSNSTSFVACHAPKVEPDVMSEPHHI